MVDQGVGADTELEALLAQRAEIEKKIANMAKRQADEIAEKISELLDHPAYVHVHGRTKMAIANKAASLCGGNWKLGRSDE